MLSSGTIVAACGGTPAGPSVVPAADPPSSMPTPSARPSTWPSPPAGLDPVYVRVLGHVSAAGIPRHWEGGPFRHCFGRGVDVGVAEQAANLMVRVTGIQRTETGPCNVDWIIDDTAAGSGYAELHGSETSIVKARVVLRTKSIGYAAGHEAGHVIGLDHSPRRADLMHAEITRGGFDFTDAELAVLAWIYAPVRGSSPARP